MRQSLRAVLHFLFFAVLFVLCFFPAFLPKKDGPKPLPVPQVDMSQAELVYFAKN